MKPIGIITGMASEARCLEAALVHMDPDHKPLVRVAGANSSRAGVLAQELASIGVSGLMSFGVAGGLDPDCRMGDILLPTAIQNELGHKIECDAGWQHALEGLYAGWEHARPGSMLTVDRVLATAVEKAAFFQKTQAVGVDMESYPVAKVASHMGLPFAVLRIVFDVARNELPESSLRVINKDGTISPGRVIHELLQNPAEIGPLMSAGLKASKAKRTMKELALGGLPFFGLF